MPKRRQQDSEKEKNLKLALLFDEDSSNVEMWSGLSFQVDIN